jgi:hypothetical protein
VVVLVEKGKVFVSVVSFVIGRKGSEERESTVKLGKKGLSFAIGRKGKHEGK